MSPNDLALKLAQAAPQHVAFDDVIIVADALATLGYSFEPPGVPGRYHESDEAQHSMRLYLCRTTGLAMQPVRNVLVAIEQIGLRIREPNSHPSGFCTSAAAFENVLKSGAARAAAQKPIDQRMPGMGKNYV